MHLLCIRALPSRNDTSLTSHSQFSSASRPSSVLLHIIFGLSPQSFRPRACAYSIYRKCIVYTALFMNYIRQLGPTTATTSESYKSKGPRCEVHHGFLMASGAPMNVLLQKIFCTRASPWGSPSIPLTPHHQHDSMRPVKGHKMQDTATSNID